MNEQATNDSKQDLLAMEQPERKEESTSSETQQEKPVQQSTPDGLPWSFYAIAAGVFFLLTHKDKLGHKGGFVYVIGAIVIGVLSAYMLGRK